MRGGLREAPFRELLQRLPLVDGHHHFWQIGRFPYRWLAPTAPPARFGDKASISGDYLPKQYLADFEGIPPSASVHVQANCGAANPVDETRWLQDLSDRTGWPAAIVAEADLSAPDAAATIRSHWASPALRGVRTPVAWDRAGRWRVASRPGVMSERGFRRAAALLEEHDLCLELVVVPEQLPEVAALAHAHPELKIVINHFATLEPSEPGNEADWREGLSRLADTPGVFVKISGLWTVDRRWRAEVLSPHLRYLLRTVGSRRCLYGSNLPVERVNSPVSRQFEQLAILLADRSPEELGDIFSRTARAVYRLTNVPEA